MISPLLKQFLTSWHTWAIADNPQDGPFDAAEGLCDSYYKWLLGPGQCTVGRGTDNMLKELTDQFRAQGLDDAYPFGWEAYDKRSDEGTMHKDPRRLAWVKEMLENN